MSATIRPGRASDLAALEALYPAAFPDEELLPLVRELARDRSRVTSLVATLDEVLVGHLALTACGVEGSHESVALLGPLAVVPAHQRAGLGTALIREALSRLDPGSTRALLVLGDPAYYGRFGFTAEREIAPPYPLPPEWASAWQSIRFDDAHPLPARAFEVPPAWSKPELWSP